MDPIVTLETVGLSNISLQIGINQVLGLFEILISVFGVILATKIRRPSIFRMKLALVYMFLFISGFISFSFLPVDVTPQNIHDHWAIIANNIFIATFAFHITILYYREMKKYTSREGFFKQKVIDFMDHIPDCVFVQDREGKYMYVNQAFCSLLNLPKEEIINKDNIELGMFLQKLGIKYDFDILDERSNNIIKEIDKPYIFIDSGYIANDYYSLQVYKSPVYNECFADGNVFRKYIGTIGITRDMTYDVIDHEEIDERLQDNDLEGALSLFYKHKTRRDTNPFTKEFLQEVQQEFQNKDVYLSSSITDKK